MIEKNEILQLAESLGLSADTVEKDYVLGWILHGISQHPDLGDSWLFKGGTSLKKCFFETFRFSEDLDFTLKQETHLSPDYLRKTFHEIADQLYEETGIEFSKEMFKFKIRPKESAGISVEGQVHYNGPLRRKQGVASIKLDLTNDEIIVVNSERKRVHHPYTDELSGGIWTHCYAFEEVVAEKIRALAQRARPRDVYDVVHFFRNRAMIKNPQLVHNILVKKCSFKKIAVPTFETIEKHEKIAELEQQWSNMLAHQLPNLPTLESFWRDLSPFFDWLNSNLQEEKKVAFGGVDEMVFQPGRVANAYSMDVVLQRIQFAAANRVCVELTYHDKVRTLEPLSFRRAKNGNRLFYGHEREEGIIKAYSLNKIQGVQITNEPYSERGYPVEISASGSISMPPIRRSSSRF
jgi:predicted nucleotidyltransferase component of viral defense system